MTDAMEQGPAFDEAVRRIVREVLRAELIDYIATQKIKPEQIQTSNNNNRNVAPGHSLKIDTDGIVRFLL